MAYKDSVEISCHLLNVPPRLYVRVKNEIAKSKNDIASTLLGTACFGAFCTTGIWIKDPTPTCTYVCMFMWYL